MAIDGGDWPAGMAIFDAIRAASSHIEIISYAQASSMSGVILQSGDTRVLMPNTYFLAHFGSIGVDTTSQAASEAVRFNNKETEKMVAIFAEKCVNGPFFKSHRWGATRVGEYLSGQMKEKGDWYLTAEEAVEMGFADRIFGE